MQERGAQDGSLLQRNGCSTLATARGERRFDREAAVSRLIGWPSAMHCCF